MIIQPREGEPLSSESDITSLSAGTAPLPRASSRSCRPCAGCSATRATRPCTPPRTPVCRDFTKTRRGRRPRSCSSLGSLKSLNFVPLLFFPFFSFFSTVIVSLISHHCPDNNKQTNKQCNRFVERLRQFDRDGVPSAVYAKVCALLPLIFLLVFEASL